MKERKIFSINLISLCCVITLIFVQQSKNTDGFSIKSKVNNRTAFTSFEQVQIPARDSMIVLPETRKSNLELLLSLAPAFMQNSNKYKSDIGTLKERGVVPVTHEEEDPLPILPVAQLATSTEPPKENSGLISTTIKHSNSSIPAGLIVGSMPTKASWVQSPVFPTSPSGALLPIPFSSAPEIIYPPTSQNHNGDNEQEAPVKEDLNSIAPIPTSINEDHQRPMTNFQSIKDAYFDLLQQFKEFKFQATKKISSLEREVEIHLDGLNHTNSMDRMTLRIGDIYDKITEVDLRHNMSRLIDVCVYKIAAEDITGATSLWQKVEMSIPNPNEIEIANVLKEIVSLSYIRNKTNANPVFHFLRKLQDVDKIPSYEYLLDGMRERNNYDGPEIFYIAQYLKEHNAVRSSLYSKIPKSVQHAVSGRNLNVIYYESRTGRNYLHVRDDGNRRDRHNFYIQASQSYTDSKAAVWRAVFYPATESFRIRNILFNDYMFINDEGFLETTSMANANQPGTEFNLAFDNNYVVFRSKNYNNEPVVGTWRGGRFPFYFSLSRGKSDKHVANFVIEPDSLL